MRTQVEQVRKNDYEKTEKYEKYNTDERTMQKLTDQINEEKIINLLEREFQNNDIPKMFQKLANRMQKMQKTFNTVNTITKDMEKKKNKQTEITQLLKLKILQKEPIAE